MDYKGIVPSDRMYVSPLPESLAFHRSIRHFLSFPQSAVAFSDEAIYQALEFARLSHRASLMNEKFNADNDFSEGERQKLTFARVFLHRPKILCLDNATSHLPRDEAIRLYRGIFAALADSLILSASTSDAIVNLHERKGTLIQEQFILPDSEGHISQDRKSVIIPLRNRPPGLVA